MRFENFVTLTRSRTAEIPIDTQGALEALAEDLLLRSSTSARTPRGGRSVSSVSGRRSSSRVTERGGVYLGAVRAGGPRPLTSFRSPRRRRSPRRHHHRTRRCSLTRRHSLTHRRRSRHRLRMARPSRCRGRSSRRAGSCDQEERGDHRDADPAQDHQQEEELRVAQ